MNSRRYVLILTLLLAFSAITSVNGLNVIARIDVTNNIGNFSNGGVYDYAKGEVFLTGYNNTVYVISEGNNSVISSIAVGAQPRAIAYDSEKGELFVTNYDSGSVSVISDVNNTVVSTISGLENPYDIIYDSGKGEVFVLVYNSTNINPQDYLAVISDTNNSIISTISLPKFPNGGPYGGGTVWITGFGTMAYDSVKNEIFVTNYYQGTVSVISDTTNSIVSTVQVEYNPYGIAYDYGKGEMYVTNDGSDSVSIISDITNTVVATVPVGAQLSTQKHLGGEPYRILYDSDSSEVYVANPNSNTVSVISDNSHSVTATVPVSIYPCSIVEALGKGQVFVSCAGEGTGSTLVISDNSHEVIANITLDFNGLPGNLIYNPSKDEVFAANSGDSIVYVLIYSQNVAPNSLTYNITIVATVVGVILIVTIAFLLRYRRHRNTTNLNK